MAWLSEHWQSLLLSLLAIDAALIPIFPNAGILVVIKNVLSGAAPK